MVAQCEIKSLPQVKKIPEHNAFSFDKVDLCWSEYNLKYEVEGGKEEKTTGVYVLRHHLLFIQFFGYIFPP